MTEHASLTAERSFLEARLAEVPAHARLTRQSTESRLRAVGEQLARLSRDNLQESVIALEGSFEGLLPKRRTFEFRRADTGEVVGGKMAAAIERPEAVNDHLGEPVIAQFAQTTVGHGRPRYVLQALPEWPA